MKKSINALISVAVLTAMASGATNPALADPPDHGQYNHGDHGNFHAASQHQHRHWHKGGQIAREDWDHGHAIDYRAHRLHAPPPGYEWRQIGPNFVLAAVATGVIASIIASAGH